MTKIKIKNKHSGFVILFAVTLAAILLSIALGVGNIALKEMRFGTSAKDTNDAFSAADTGIECALFNDKSTSNSFVETGGSGVVQCKGSSISLVGAFPSWTFVVSGLGSGGKSCANVSVVKNNSAAPVITTTVVSKGYNIGNALCNSTNPSRVERELETSYVTGSSSSTRLYDNVTDVRVQVNNSLGGYSRIVELEAWGSGTNYALASNGATAVASSEYSSNYPASSTINGDRRGVGWSTGNGGWNDGTLNIWNPDTLTVTFDEPKSLDEIDVYTLANSYPLASDPTLSDTFSSWGITHFYVQYSTDGGNSWTTIPGGNVTGNDKIWRSFALP